MSELVEICITDHPVLAENHELKGALKAARAAVDERDALLELYHGAEAIAEREAAELSLWRQWRDEHMRANRLEQELTALKRKAEEEGR